MVATILRIQVMATLNGPKERAAFERVLKALGLASKPMLTQEELTKVGLACAAEVAQGLAKLTPQVREHFGQQMASVMEAHERRDPEALDELALIFRQTFKASS